MSIKFAARYQISYVEDLGGGDWEVTGKIYDTSTFGFSASDALVGDVIIDENSETGAVNRWKLTEIGSASGRDLVCTVIWDDEGSEDTSGPQICAAAICRTSTHVKFAEIPTLAYSDIAESVQTRIHNINNRFFADNAIEAGTSGTSGSSGVSGTSGSSGADGSSGSSGSSGTSGADGTSGTSGADGTSGTSGADGTSGTSGADGTSGSSGSSGSSGTSGVDGSSGTSGDGTSGSSGSSGSSGETGTSGSSGTSGINGTSGTSGLVSTYQYTNTYSASTSWTVSHNLGSDLVMVQCFNDDDPKKMIMPSDVTLDTQNQCTIEWAGKSVAGSVCVMKF